MLRDGLRHEHSRLVLETRARENARAKLGLGEKMLTFWSTGVMGRRCGKEPNVATPVATAARLKNRRRSQRNGSVEKESDNLHWSMKAAPRCEFLTDRPAAV